MKYIENLTNSLENINTSLKDEALLNDYSIIVKEMCLRLRHGGRIYIAGNGGSAADAGHLAAELVCKIGRERPPIAAESLMTDTALLTAISNDFGYKYTISRQLEAKCNFNDVFIAISTSGNSENILEGFKVCPGYKILLTGNKPCKGSNLCDIVLKVSGYTTDQIQQQHEILYHSLVYDIENELFFNRSNE